MYAKQALAIMRSVEDAAFVATPQEYPQFMSRLSELLTLLDDSAPGRHAKMKIRAFAAALLSEAALREYQGHQLDRRRIENIRHDGPALAGLRGR